MAGGSGTRLWPASNSKMPKQFLTIPSGNAGKNSETFFCAALRRALSVTNSKDSRIIIISGDSNKHHIEDACAQFPAAERARMLFLCEPCAKNTAAAIALAAIFCKLTSLDKNNKILVLTSDHIIEPEHVFAEQALGLLKYIEQDKLAVFGIKPDFPQTAYGYIETQGISIDDKGHYKAASFHEKPDAATAQKYLAAGNFFWNSGMFAFTRDFILNEFKTNNQNVLAAFKDLLPPQKESWRVKNGLAVLENWDGLTEAYNKTESISFDYAIAEKCKNVIMAKTNFAWTDVGSWDEYARLSETNSGISTQNCFLVDSSGTFVLSDIPVAVCGCNDLVVVIHSNKDGTPASALILKKGESQKMREVIDQIKEKGRTDIL
jgi:mannose-1-phosphate guanylyltransferase/mannose-6-phosphate isomerase